MLNTRIINRRYNSISFLIALLLILSTTNILVNVFDCQKYSIMLLVSYTVIIYFLFFHVFQKNGLSKTFFTPIDIITIFTLLYILLKSTIASSLTIISHASFILLYLQIRYTSKLNYRIIYAGVLFACSILSTYGYLQYFEVVDVENNYFQITGPFTNPAPYGGMLGFLILVIFIVIFLNKKESGIVDYFSSSILIFSLPPFILSSSRAAWLALIIGLFFVASNQYTEQFKKLSLKVKYIYIITSLLIILLVCVGLFMLKPDSAKGRILIWKVSLNMTQDKPIFGLGHGGVEAYYMHFQESYFRNSLSTMEEQYLAGNNHSTFNEPLRFWIEYGILGLILYLLLTYLVLFKTKVDGVVSIAAKALLIMFFVFGLFSYPCRIFQHKLIYIITLAILLNHQKQFTVDHSNSNKLFKSLKIGSIIVAIMLISFLIKQHSLYYYCNKSISAYYSKKNSDILSDLVRFELAIPNNNVLLIHYIHIARQEGQDSLFFKKLTQYSALHPTNRLYIQRGDYLKSHNNYKLAEEEYWKAHYMIPSQQKARSHIAILYAETGRIVEAKELALELLNEKVKIFGFETFELHSKLEEILYQ